MSYNVDIENRARREILALPAKIVSQIISAIDGLEDNPRPMGAKKMSGREGYRLRQGDYRILYTIDDKNRTVRIYRVGNRRDI